MEAILKRGENIYLIGIGGMGMATLAEMTKAAGLKVLGSDANIKSANVSRLVASGIKVYESQVVGRLKRLKPDLVVYSSAIQTDNNELKEARALGIKTLSRFELLLAIIKNHKYIAVAGTHGKTSTTSLIAYLAQKNNLKAYTYLGGKDDCLKNPKIDSKTSFVIETDESDCSFLLARPNLAVITNIDRDHLIAYGNKFANLKKAFQQFANQSHKIILCWEDKNVRQLSQTLPRTACLSYGFDRKADLHAQDIKFLAKGTKAKLYYKGQFIGELNSPLLGTKYLLNTLGAILAARQMGVNFNLSLKALKNYTLPHRRCEILLATDRVILVDDHADHPTEVKATLEALKTFQRRLVIIYEPHRFTRMSSLGSDLVGSAFSLANVIITVNLCPAGEVPIKGINGKVVNKWIKKFNPQKPVYYVADWHKVPQFLKKKLQPGDVVACLGPGTIAGLASLLRESLR